MKKTLSRKTDSVLWKTLSRFLKTIQVCGCYLENPRFSSVEDIVKNKPDSSLFKTLSGTGLNQLSKTKIGSVHVSSFF